MAFVDFKEACRKDCHEKEACKEGFVAMMNAKNYVQMIAVWDNYWPEIIGSKFFDVIERDLQEYYDEDKEEFNRAGFYYNEDTDKGLCLVTDKADGREIRVGGDCHCYVCGKAKVVASDHAKVWNKTTTDASVELRGYATGYIYAGTLEITGRSTAYTSVDARCTGACKVFLSGKATLEDHGHRRIYAMDDSLVRSFTTRGIELTGNAKIENE